MNRLCMILLLTTVLSLGFALGVLSQSSPLARLAEESASISKMDWILLKTRIYVLEQDQPGSPFNDRLSLSITPTSYSYDSKKQQIRISLYVDPSWLAKTGREQVNKAFSARATSICVASVMGQTASGDLLAEMQLTEAHPVEWCAVTFFTLGLDNKGNIEPKDLAIFERGKLAIE